MAIDLEAILYGYSAGVRQDQRFVKLLSYLETQGFDGSEINGVRKELNRFGLGRAINNILRAIEQKYGGTIPTDIVVGILAELFTELLEKEGRA